MDTVLSAFRFQTTPNPARTFLNIKIRHGAINQAANSRHRGSFPGDVRRRRGDAHDTENVNDRNHHSQNYSYRKYPSHPEIDQRQQMNSLLRWDTCTGKFSQDIGFQKPAEKYRSRHIANKSNRGAGCRPVGTPKVGNSKPDVNECNEQKPPKEITSGSRS